MRNHRPVRGIAFGEIFFGRLKRSIYAPLHSLNVRSNGHVQSVNILAECADDPSVIEAARRLAIQQQIELWDRARLVAKFD
jgi:hypothetical protein